MIIVMFGQADSIICVGAGLVLLLVHCCDAVDRALRRFRNTLRSCSHRPLSDNMRTPASLLCTFVCAVCSSDSRSSSVGASASHLRTGRSTNPSGTGCRSALLRYT
jgi:hypothetical protein